MVVLRDIRDAHGTRFLEARLESDGTLVIEGQDLGDGVAEVFGEGLREYEWTWRVAPGDVPVLAERVATRLEAPADLGILPLLFLLYDPLSRGSLEEFVGPDRDRIPAAFWSRIGD
jgi:hypothetical protein